MINYTYEMNYYDIEDVNKARFMDLVDRLWGIKVIDSDQNPDTGMWHFVLNATNFGRYNGIKKLLEEGFNKLSYWTND